MNRTIHSCQPVTYNKTKNKHGRAKYQLVILSKTEKSNGAGNTARTTLNLKTFHLDKSTSRLPKCVAALRAARQKSVFLLAKRDLVTGHSGQLGGRWWHARGRLWDYLLRQAIETGASIVPVLKQVGIRNHYGRSQLSRRLHCVRISTQRWVILHRSVSRIT